MSYNVLVIPEDFTKDEHILKPLVEAVMHEAGKPKAVVQVCRNPNFQGITECLKVERLRHEVVRRYPMVNLLSHSGRVKTLAFQATASATAADCGMLRG